MNYNVLWKYLGVICAGIGLAMAPTALWAVYFGEWRSLAAILGSVTIAEAVGAAMIFAGRGSNVRMFEREAVGIVGLAWAVTSVLGALPFYLGGTLGFVDALFESASGFTTSGCTVIGDIEAVDKSILFWRSFTHWIGGIGILILFVAVLPYFGFGGKLITRSETTGPTPSRLRARFRTNAALIVQIYTGFTVIFAAALMAAGMDLFDALCHTFGALATGGFSPRQASIAAYDSLLVEIILIACMIVGGTNFALFGETALGNWKAFWKDPEWRLFLGILAGATLLITLNLLGYQGAFPLSNETFKPVEPGRTYESVGQAFRVASFQVVSCMTTTGYVTEDFDAWPAFSRACLLFIMFIGGCASSTGSGVKVVRLLMLLKIGYWRLEATFRPKTVRPLRVGDEIVSEDTQRKLGAFMALYICWFMAGCLFMSWLGLPFESAFSAMVATLNNIGPGLEHVGAIRDYRLIPDSGKLFLTLTMLLGRLEIVALLALFMPGFWRR